MSGIPTQDAVVGEKRSASDELIATIQQENAAKRARIGEVPTALPGGMVASAATAAMQPQVMAAAAVASIPSVAAPGVVVPQMPVAPQAVGVVAGDASRETDEIKRLLQREAIQKQELLQKQQQRAKPSPSGKQSMRCQVCIRAKKGGCGTERAVYRCLRRPGGPRAASLLLSGVPDAKADPQANRKPKKSGDDGSWFDLETRVSARFSGSWATGSIARVHRNKRTPYAVKLDVDTGNTQLTWVSKSVVFPEGGIPATYNTVELGAEEALGFKEDESLSEVAEDGKAFPQAALSATSPLIGLSSEMAMQMNTGINKYTAVVRDAATGGVKLCRKCNQPALPGNYGFCSLHRTPRSRGSGKQAENGQNNMSLMQRLQQQGAAANAFQMPPSMANVGSLPPGLLPGFFSQSGEATAVPAASAPGAAAAATINPSMMMSLGGANIRGAQDLPIVYGSVPADSFNIPSMTGVPVGEAQVATPIPATGAGDMKEGGGDKEPTSDAVAAAAAGLQGVAEGDDVAMPVKVPGMDAADSLDYGLGGGMSSDMFSGKPGGD